MSDVWIFLYTVLGSVIDWFKSIPVYQGSGVTVYLWQFLIALLILSVVISATVSIVQSAPGDIYGENLRIEKREELHQRRLAEAEERRQQRRNGGG